MRTYYMNIYIYMFSLYQISSIIYSIATKTYFYKYQI
jgi:hypothetical protein